MRNFEIPPSEFWRMKPRHFWWLVETLEKQKSGPSLSKADADELLELMAMAERGEF